MLPNTIEWKLNVLFINPNDDVTQAFSGAVTIVLQRDWRKNIVFEGISGVKRVKIVSTGKYNQTKINRNVSNAKT